MFKKTNILTSILILLSFLISFSIANNAQALIGDPCPEGTQEGADCTDGGQCYYDKCIETFISKVTGDSCMTGEGALMLPEGTPCSDGSLCYEGICKKTCNDIVAYAGWCDDTDTSQGRCYPREDNENYPNNRAQICVIPSEQVVSEGTPCGTEWGTCKTPTFNIDGVKTCGEGYKYDSGSSSQTNPAVTCGTNLLCCVRDVEYCPTLEYGDACPGTDAGFCYDGVCEKEKGTEEGALCGNDGGVCTESFTGICPGNTEGDSAGGRDCDGTILSPLFCCIDNNALPESVCKNKEDGDSCGDGGYCFDGECSEFGYAGPGEICGTSGNGTCQPVTSGQTYTSNCTNNGLKHELNGRLCSDPTTSICCAPYSTPPIGSTPINPDNFEKTLKTCEVADLPEEGRLLAGLNVFKKAIVPCGRSCDDPRTLDDPTVAGVQNNEMDECTICHFIIMGKNVYDLVLALIVIVSLLMITAGGVLYMLSGANPNMNSLAKEIIKKTLIGFTLFLTSWLIINTALIIMSATPGSMLGSGGTWYEFTCDTKSVFQQDYK